MNFGQTITLKKLEAVSALGLIVLLLVLISYLSKAFFAQCQPLVPSERAKVLISYLDKDLRAFSSSTKQIYNESSEGGVQTNYKDGNGHLRIGDRRLFGEIGRTFKRFYFDDGKVFALVERDEQCKVPISVDPNVDISKSTEEDYYFSSNERVCTHLSNGKPEPLATTTQEMVESLISQIQK